MESFLPNKMLCNFHLRNTRRRNEKHPNKRISARSGQEKTESDDVNLRSYPMILRQSALAEIVISYHPLKGQIYFKTSHHDLLSEV